MNRYEFLAALHRAVRPRTYLEIGVNDGRSLTLSRVPSVAIDPAFKVVTELNTDVHLVRATSDEFFTRSRPLAHLGDRPVDLAFVDGMHLAEFALRDFMNVERHTAPTSVVVLDDMLPRSVDEAARDRHTTAWTGDVYKVLEVLREHRPDLVVIEVDTQPTGVAVVLGLDAGSTVLQQLYPGLVGQLVVPDPQDLPVDTMSRARAVDPDALVTSKAWRQLVQLRHRRRADPAQVRALALELAAAGPVTASQKGA